MDTEVLDGYDTEDETAVNTLKQVMNVSQRMRVLEGCLISTRVADKDCVLNAHAIGAAQEFMRIVEEDSGAVVGPPVTHGGHGGADGIGRAAGCERSSIYSSRRSRPTSLVERLRGEKMEIAAEYIKYWRAKTTFAKEGGGGQSSSLVLHSCVRADRGLAQRVDSASQPPGRQVPHETGARDEARPSAARGPREQAPELPDENAEGGPGQRW
ncbi:unnamed protein product [Prorocentrum cordatum]|uniref:Uncharacterized protein n=1 Tax=Prorocentrum cordatum TaxID=2364126 RepID=A0ABN9T2M3_9DINO|nr:unnamed protein product [Polarella glacialis]